MPGNYAVDLHGGGLAFLEAKVYERARSGDNLAFTLILSFKSYSKLAFANELKVAKIVPLTFNIRTYAAKRKS